MPVCNWCGHSRRMLWATIISNVLLVCRGECASRRISHAADLLVIGDDELCGRFGGVKAINRLSW